MRRNLAYAAIAFTVVVAPVGLMVAALSTGVAEAAGCQPTITSVTALTGALAGPGRYVIIGNCFGTATPWTAADRSYLRISDLGLNGALPNSIWNACWTGDPATDGVTCNVTEWIPNRIVVNGFTGAYGQGYVVTSGEHLAFQVWNAQTGTGPAVFTIEYRTTSTSPVDAGGTVVFPSHHNPKSSTIAHTLASPSSAFSDVSSDVVNATIAVGAALFITFPANLFNQTFEENYADIRAWWRRRFGWLFGNRARSTDAVASNDETGTRWRRLAIVVAGGAILGGFLDPAFGVNVRSVITVLALAAAISIGIAVPAVVAVAYHRAHHGDTRLNVRALPAGLAIAAACVFVSRISGFEPGYLYGVVAGVALGRALAKREQAHLVALSTLAVIAVSVIAWIGWAAINPTAQSSGASDALIWLDDALAATFVAGLVGSVIGMMPIRFLPGHVLKSWHTGAWAAVFCVSLFGLVQVLLRPHATTEGPSHAPLVTTILLFVAFAVGTIAFRWHFVQKRLRAEASDSADLPWQKTLHFVLGTEAKGAVQLAATTDGVSIVDLTDEATVPAQRSPRARAPRKSTAERR